MDNSILRRLPPELRIHIFKEALTLGVVYHHLPDTTDWEDEELVTAGTWCVSQGECNFFSPRKYPPLADFLSLTLVCKQVRLESATLLLQANILHIGDSEEHRDCRGDWCRTGTEESV